MSKAIGEMSGMTPDLEKKLGTKGVKDSNQLLELVKTPADRRSLAKELEIDSSQVLNLANRADLARVSGIGAVYADLLKHAGVDTVKELAMRRPDNLHAKMLEINQEKGLTKRDPRPDEVQNWVSQARELPKTLEY